MEAVLTKNLDKLLQAVGDPFHFPALPLQYGRPEGATNYEPMMTAIVLIEALRHRICGGTTSVPRISPPMKSLYPQQKTGGLLSDAC